MIVLKVVNFSDIAAWQAEYQKKSRNADPIPEAAEFLGMFKGTELVGYFVTLTTTDNVLEIVQGFVKPEAQHKRNSYLAMEALERLARQHSIKQIVLSTNRAVGSYKKFMERMGFKLTQVIFKKELR